MFKTLEEKLAGLIDLPVRQRSTLIKMGDKSETFYRQTVELLSSSPGALLANFNL